MSEVVTYTTTVILGVAARSALLAAAGTLSAISKGTSSLSELKAPGVWQKKLIDAETQVLRQNLKDSVEASGYQISERDGNIRATKGTTCIWVEFGGRGDMSLDVSGFSGLSCQKAISALETQLLQRGIVLQRKSSHFHGRPEGGDVAQRLAKIFSTVKQGPAATGVTGKAKARSKRKRQTRQTVRS